MQFPVVYLPFKASLYFNVLFTLTAKIVQVTIVALVYNNEPKIQLEIH